jgi:hypothetical protein
MTAADEANPRGDVSPGRLEPMLATLGSLEALGPDREWGFEMNGTAFAPSCTSAPTRHG